MRNDVQISVIIPVYNAADSIRNTVDGLMMQDFPSFEVVLVDDGSTDGSSMVCDDLVSVYEGVRVIHKPNGGVSSARNAGLDAASGEYVMFLDADDVLKPETLKKMAALDADMVMGGFEKVVDSEVVEVNRPCFLKKYEGADDLCRFLDDNIGEKDCFLLNSSCFKLYRRELIEAYSHRFDESLRYGEDKIFVFGFLRYISSASTLPESVYEYHIRKESLSSDVTSDSHLSQIFLLLESYVPLLEELGRQYPSSVRLAGLYHIDVVSRYVCRILTCFARRKSSLMNHESMAGLYAYMKKDDRLNLLSVRAGQVPNILLFKIGSIRLALNIYRLTSSIFR